MRQRVFSILCAGEARHSPDASNLSDGDHNSGEQSARLKRQHYLCQPRARKSAPFVLLLSRWMI